MRLGLVIALAGCWRGQVPEEQVEPTPSLRRMLPARAVALVGDELWVAMGTCGDSALWRSWDRGARWIPVDLPGVTGLERIVGGEHPDDVALLGATCLSGKKTLRYHLWISDAHGSQWHELDPPVGFRGGFVTMGFAHRTLRFSWRNGNAGGNWELAANREWDEIPQPAIGPPRSVTLDGITYRPSRDGLIVESRAGAKTVYPR